MDLSLSLLLIRFTVGMLLMGHGAQKLVGVAGGPGLRTWIGAVGKMGFRPPALWALAAAGSEFLGGLAMAIGFFTPVAAALVVADMFVAIVKVHWSKGLWVTGGGSEYALTVLLVATAIGLGGPGRYSVDAALGWDLISGVVFVPLAALAVIVDALVIRAAPSAAAPRREERPARDPGRRAA